MLRRKRRWEDSTEFRFMLRWGGGIGSPREALQLFRGLNGGLIPVRSSA
jgi:hypothetical protein